MESIAAPTGPYGTGSMFLLTIPKRLYILVLIRRDTVYASALKAAEMGLKLRGARDVDVGMLGSLGVDQGERPNNVGCC